MGDRCYEHGGDECLGCTSELRAEVERLRNELKAWPPELRHLLVSTTAERDRLGFEVERLQNQLDECRRGRASQKNKRMIAQRSARANAAGLKALRDQLDDYIEQAHLRVRALEDEVKRLQDALAESRKLQLRHEPIQESDDELTYDD